MFDLHCIVQGGRCIWKTTTFGKAGKVGRDRDAQAVAAAQRHGWLLLDAWAATLAAKTQLPDDPYVDEACGGSCHGLGCGW